VIEGSQAEPATGLLSRKGLWGGPTKGSNYSV